MDQGKEKQGSNVEVRSSKMTSSRYRLQVFTSMLALLRFKFYDEEYGHETAAVWRTINPSFNMEQLITVERADQDLLHYLHSSALIVELWGLQGNSLGSARCPINKSGLSKPKILKI